MEVWPESEESPWYNLHTADSKYDVAYGKRHGYTVIDVPPNTLARWQRVLSDAQGVLGEIDAWLQDAVNDRRG